MERLSYIKPVISTNSKRETFLVQKGSGLYVYCTPVKASEMGCKIGSDSCAKESRQVLRLQGWGLYLNRVGVGSPGAMTGFFGLLKKYAKGLPETSIIQNLRVLGLNIWSIV